MKQLVFWCLLFAVAPANGQDADSRARVTSQRIQSRIRAARDSREFQESTRARILELCGQAITNLESARANRELAQQYRQAAETAPAEADAILAAIEGQRAEDPSGDLEITPSTPSEWLEQRLEEARANLAALEARLAALDARIDRESRRPAQTRARIREARLLTEEIAERSDQDQGGHPWLVEARGWAAVTQLDALESEIAMLDRETLSQPGRTRLLRARRDKATLGVTRIGQRVAFLRRAVSERRQAEARRAMDQAQSALDGVSGSVPIVRDLAAANLELGRVLMEQADKLEALSERESVVRPLVARVAHAYRSTRRKLQLEGASAPLALSIRELREQLPEARTYSRERRLLQREIGAVSLRRVEYDEQRNAVQKRESYLADRAGPAGLPTDPDVLAQLDALASSRATLLDRITANDVTRQRRLYALDDILRQLEENTLSFDEYLSKRMRWVRSSNPISAKTFAALPGELAAYGSPRSWVGALRASVPQWWGGPGVLLALGLLLLLGRRRLRSALENHSRNIGRVRQDGVAATLKSVFDSLLLALPVPLMLGGLGWAFSAADDASEFSAGIGGPLWNSAILLLSLTWPRVLSAPGGVAERHFGTRPETAADLHRVLGWAIGLGIPLYFVTASAVELHPATTGGALGKLGIVALTLAISIFLVRLAHPTKGTVRAALAAQRESLWWRWRYVWFLLLVAIPLAALALAIRGYGHTAGEIVSQVIFSLWLLLFVWLALQITNRWLLITRRRLAFQVALKAHEEKLAQQSAKGTGEETSRDGIGAPAIDLVTLDEDSRKLLHAGVLLVAILGLVGIWGDMVPALGIFEGIRLWGAVTVLDLLAAVVIALAGYVTAKNLPSLLNIFLLKRGRMSAGGRYAATTLTRYTIVAIATLMTLGKLGASWGQLGFAAAALGVGIGFGLQEIVANFICGLILLFERPVNVGDVVTIGDTSGTVTRIRIRATTIRNWDRMELVVPNKELITGRLLNWTLTDAITRIVVPVGVAYGSDVALAMKLLQEAAAENARVLDDPVPSVVFDGFGDSSLDLKLRAFVPQLSDRIPTMSALHNEIDQKFREAKVVIAFPQRDVHLFTTDQGEGAKPEDPGPLPPQPGS